MAARIASRVLTAVCVLVALSVAVLVWGVRSSNDKKSRNEARARVLASAEANAFAHDIRSTLARGPVTPAQLASAGRKHRVGDLSVRMSGRSVVATFGVVETYAVPGGVALGEVDLCFSETVTRSGQGVRGVLAPVSCGTLPQPSVTGPVLTLPS